jgi:hypothetical protein
LKGEKQMAERSTTERGSVERENMRIFLQPISAASILGLLAFFGATWVVGGQYAGWYTGPQVNVMPGAYVAVLGGIIQILAAMWAFRNRDGLGTAFHGVWGAFWLAFGIQNFLYSMELIPAGAEGGIVFTVGFWWIAMAWITAACTAAAMATNLALFSTMAVITAGCIAMAVGFLAASPPTLAVAGYLLVISSVLAWYTGTAMMLEDAFGYRILPIGEFRASTEEEEVSVGVGEPGVLHGQWGAFNKKRRLPHRRETERREPSPPIEA